MTRPLHPFLRVTCAAAALLLCPVHAAAEEPPVRIALRTQAEVTGRQVRLGDVATIETLDLAMLERLMALPIGPAPRTGTAVRLRRGPLLRWIRARTGLAAERVAWAGADEVAVRVTANNVPGTALDGVARQALAAAAADRELRVELVVTRPTGDIAVPAGAVELRAHSVPGAALRTGRTSVWVHVRVDGSLVRSVPVSFDLSVLGPAPLAGGPREPVGGLGRAPVEPPAALAVTKGSWATLIDGAGLLRLERRVQVLEDGRPGQEVRVRPSGGEAPILARVSGPGALEVVP